MNSSDKHSDHFFAGGGFVSAPVTSDRDSMEALDDLMVVVEAMCQTWPQRGTFKDSKTMLL
jgi:hypothetical protein